MFPVKQFLINEPTLNLTAIASLMWPANSSARAYLEKKLTGVRKWNETDESNALRVLKELAVKIDSIG